MCKNFCTEVGHLCPYIWITSTHTFGIRKFLQHICCSVSIGVVWWYFVVKFSYTVYSCCTILYFVVLVRSGVLLSCATTDEHLNSAVIAFYSWPSNHLIVATIFTKFCRPLDTIYIYASKLQFMTKTTTRQQYCLLQETAAPTGSQEEATLPDLPSRVPTSLISRMNNIFTEYLTFDIVAPRGCVEAFGQRLPLVPSLPPSRCGWWSCIHEYPNPENIQPNIQN